MIIEELQRLAEVIASCGVSAALVELSKTWSDTLSVSDAKVENPNQKSVLEISSPTVTIIGNSEKPLKVIFEGNNNIIEEESSIDNLDKIFENIIKI